MTPSSLVIFDLDGTQFRTESGTLRAVQERFKKAGLPIPAAHTVLDFICKPSSDLEMGIPGLERSMIGGTR